MKFSQQRFQEYFQQNNDMQKLDGFLCTKSENIYYLTDFIGTFGFFIYQKNSPSILISDSRYKIQAEQFAIMNFCEFVLFTTESEFIEKIGKKFSGKWGIETSNTIQDLEKYKKLFPYIKFIPHTHILENIRRKKTEYEITTIKDAQATVDLLLYPFLKEKLKINITEKELAFTLEIALRQFGKYEISFDLIIAFSENSAIPHHKPSDKTLQIGDNILIDCGIKWKNLCTDMTRNFAFQKISSEYLNKFTLLQNAQTKTLEKYKPNITGKELEKFCRQCLGTQEKYFTHSLGHGVGLEIHELPTISQRTNFALQYGDIVTCEPGLYYEGHFGMRLEDLIIIREDKYELLSNSSKNLIII